MPVDRLLSRFTSLSRKIDSQSADTKPALMNGYLARATWSVDRVRVSTNAGISIQSLKATWRVPPAPATDSGQTIFLSMAMETAASSVVKTTLLPVLQWGERDDGKGHDWSAACYCVIGQPERPQYGVKTHSFRVAHGDMLSGAISLEVKNGGVFGYRCRFLGIPGCLLYHESPYELVQTGVALQVDQLKELSNLPNLNVTRFEAVKIVLDGNTMAKPIWDVTNNAVKCNVRAVPVVHGDVQDEIDIYYR
jgi:hypothetical protein